MPKKSAVKKKAGRPATGRDPVVAGRIPADLIKAMDAWATAQGITRSSAMALLISAGLKHPPKQD